MLELKSFIACLATLLTAQDEPDALADGKRLKAIMLTDAEWAAITDLIKILKPFADVKRYISDSNYSTMSIIYPALVTLRDATLKKMSISEEGIASTRRISIRAQSELGDL